MKQLLNVVYVTKPNVYLAINGENVVVKEDDNILARYPLHNIQGIVTFSNLGISPALIGKCIDNHISVCFLTETGRYRGRIIGESNGNVLLRKAQYRISENDSLCISLAKNFILGKVYNAKWLLERYKRQYHMRIDEESIRNVSNNLTTIMQSIHECNDIDQLRGYEGSAQSLYFSVFDHMILNDKENFYFHKRTKRPPEDRVNSLLSFAYVLLNNEMASALECVGLDSYVGFMHKDRPGRTSLANDMIEELRAPIADRFVLSLINRRIVKDIDFEINENKTVYIKDEARKKFINEWQKAKQEEIIHPFLKEKVSWGLIPHIQSLLLARFIRGDIDSYPPLFWK